MNPLDYFLDAIKNKYADFSGRARRSEYWYFTLFNFLGSLVVMFLDTMIGLGFLSMIYVFGLLIPGLAVTVRRLHDTGRSGWYILLGLIPLIGGIIVLVFLVQDSMLGDNEYGPNPKEMALDDDITKHLVD